MPVAGVAHGDALHDRSQGLVSDLQERVQMIRHPTEGVHVRARALGCIGDDLIEDATVCGSAE
jgi:hypothetical protein